MAAQPARFTFDLDLGRTAARPSATGMADGAVADMVSHARQEARAAGFAEGFAEGENGLAAQSARRLADAAEALADRSATLLTTIDDTRMTIERDAIGLAASIARKLATHLMAREPAAELEALLTECLSTLEAVPHLVIRCHPELADRVRESATARASLAGFTGRLIVMGDPDIGLTDGRIEWADGGLVREAQSISGEIDDKIAAYLAARGARRPEEFEQ